jgi:hypothetical protein
MNHSALTLGNTKLGTQIAGWSLPAGEDKTCPGETPTCKAACYAKSGFFRMKNVKTAHERNFELSQQPEFAEWMTAKILVSGAPVVRVHVSGDYYDAAYIDKWRQIVTNLRANRVQLYSYTRSWQLPELLTPLLRLADNANMHLWWSMDRDTGSAPYIMGIRRAYMAISDEDAAAAPADCDLVFRDSPASVMKKANSVFVCPPENGVKLKNHITCSRCGVCWTKKAPKWENAIQVLPEFSDSVLEISA